MASITPVRYTRSITTRYQHVHQSTFYESKKTPRYLDEVNVWIAACDERHANTCIPSLIQDRPSADVPAWLIDTRQRCIVPGLSAHRYLALSYVWSEKLDLSDCASDVPRSLLLDATTLGDLQQPGYLDQKDTLQSLPVVIQHAMDFTRRLGETFLWVDRLCVVQNDGGDGGTLSQVQKMDKIYSGAYVTIIAAAPQSSYDELEGRAEVWHLLKSTKARYGRDLARTDLSSESGSSGMTEEESVHVMSKRYEDLSVTKWATRGWTYQEQILSRRAVVFLGKGVFWDCQCALWDGVDLQPTDNKAASDLRADMGCRLSTTWWPDFGLYLDSICSYSKREFSYPEDALLAISGILNVLALSFPGGFIQGLPRLFLDHALIWQPFGIVQHRRHNNDKQNDYRPLSLPSWSWVGWRCTVDPLSMRSGLSYIHEAADITRAGSWRTRNLVEWFMLLGDEEAVRIVEPLSLDRYVDSTFISDSVVQEGWTCSDVSVDGTCSKIDQAKPLCVYTKDKAVQFKHPVPIADIPQEQPLWNGSRYLTCSTTTTNLLAPAVVLMIQQAPWFRYICPELFVVEVIPHALPKISATEERIFKKGTEASDTNPILVLQQPNGMFGGLLRLMTRSCIEDITSCELIAISTGSASLKDLQESLEWSVFSEGKHKSIKDSLTHDSYYCEAETIKERGEEALFCTSETAFDRHAAVNKPQRHLFETTRFELRRLNRDAEYIAQVKTSRDRLDTQTYLEIDAHKYHEYTRRLENSWRNWFNARYNVAEQRCDAESQFKRQTEHKSHRATHPVTNKDSLTANAWSFKSNEKTDCCLNGVDEPISKTNPTTTEDNGPQKSERAADYMSEDDSEFTCDFYNVLWIERKDGVAYRRACGWVPKHIWEAHATGPVQIKLG